MQNVDQILGLRSWNVFFIFPPSLLASDPKRWVRNDPGGEILLQIAKIKCKTGKAGPALFSETTFSHKLTGNEDPHREISFPPKQKSGWVCNFVMFPCTRTTNQESKDRKFSTFWSDAFSVAPEVSRSNNEPVRFPEDENERIVWQNVLVF